MAPIIVPMLPTKPSPSTAPANPNVDSKVRDFQFKELLTGISRHDFEGHTRLKKAASCYSSESKAAARVLESII